ncbi:MAG: hypothetical protein VXW49_12005, partial [Pseudomonadota bacterium]|nr:hypothetical protein [Pseudomonadota bacterium]
MTHIALGAGLRGRDAAECAAPLFKTRKLIEGRARGRQQNHGIVTGGILGGAWYVRVTSDDRYDRCVKGSTTTTQVKLNVLS